MLYVPDTKEGHSIVALPECGVTTKAELVKLALLDVISLTIIIDVVEIKLFVRVKVNGSEIAPAERTPLAEFNVTAFDTMFAVPVVYLIPAPGPMVKDCDPVSSTVLVVIVVLLG